MDFELLDQNENVHRNLNRPYPSVSKAIRAQLDFGLSESTPTWSDEFELWTGNHKVFNLHTSSRTIYSLLI
jgi:hypothetical protein